VAPAGIDGLLMALFIACVIGLAYVLRYRL
jgi:hypothetical protein